MSIHKVYLFEEDAYNISKLSKWKGVLRFHLQISKDKFISLEI